jgi:hypothetical protein
VSDKETAKKLIERGIAVSEEDAKTDPIVLSAQGVSDAEQSEVVGLAKSPAIRGVHTEHDDDSPVVDLPAHDAIDRISRMKSKDRLEEISKNDARPTVKAAAQKRLEEMK